MPSVSKKQQNFMAAVAKNPKFAKKVGIPRSVGEEFLTADKGKKFKEGGEMRKTVKKFGSGSMSAKSRMSSLANHPLFSKPPVPTPQAEARRKDYETRLKTPPSKGLGGMLPKSALPPKGAVSRTPQAPTGKLSADSRDRLVAAKQAIMGKQVGKAQQVPSNLGNQSAKTAYQMSTQKQLQDARNAPATSRAPRAPTGKPSTTQARSTTPAATALRGLKSVAPTMYGRLTGTKMKKGGSVKHEDVKMDKKVVKKAVGMHEKQLHGGKKSDMSRLKSGGMAVKKMARGGGVEVKGKTKGTMIKMKKGGAC
jgi:hypothetical protein